MPSGKATIQLSSSKAQVQLGRGAPQANAVHQVSMQQPQPYSHQPQVSYTQQPEPLQAEVVQPVSQFMVWNAPPSQGGHQQQQQQQQPQQAQYYQVQQPQQYQQPQPYQQQPQQYQQPQPYQQQQQQYQQPQPYQQPQQAQFHPQPQQYQQQPHPQRQQAQFHQQPAQQAQFHQQPAQQAQFHQQPAQQAQFHPQPQQQQQQPQRQQAQFHPSPAVHHQQQPQRQQVQYHQQQPVHQPTQSVPQVPQEEQVPVNYSATTREFSPPLKEQPPRFIKPLGHPITVSENDVVHLETRVEPASDSSIQVEWYKDGRPIVAGSRFNTSYDRGYVVLDILHPMSDDSGEYSCVAKSNTGMDQTSPVSVTVIEDDSVITSTQLPDSSMMQQLNNLEDSWTQPRYDRQESDAQAKQPPAIVRQLQGPQRVAEAQSVHFEARVTPANDSHLQIDWYKDGHPLKSSCRYNEILDRGIVILDIVSAISEDSGGYCFIARNPNGQVQSNVAPMSCISSESVVTQSVLPDSTIQTLEMLDNPEPESNEFSRDGLRYREETEPDSPPVFAVLPSAVTVEEGCPARFLVKVCGKPMPKIQWLINDGIIGNSNLYHIYRDGPINYLEIRRTKYQGDTNVKVVAWNDKGQIQAETTLRVQAIADFRPGLKHVAPGSNFQRMNQLRRVECTPELSNALKKPRGPAENFRMAEKMSEHKARTFKSPDVMNAESLYMNVQAQLRPQERGLGESSGHAAPTKGLGHVSTDL